MSTISTSNYLITENMLPNCKYCLPCGMCDITKKSCKLKEEKNLHQKDETTTDSKTNTHNDFDKAKKIYDDLRQTIIDNNKEYSNMPKFINNTNLTTTSNIPPACKGCSNHPSNGGSGICFCILGVSSVTC